MDSKTKNAINYYMKNYDWSQPLFAIRGQKIFVGNRQNPKCRFCGKDHAHTTFRRKAHAIPQLLGNNSIFTNHECDECNQFFGSTIENDLGNWIKPSRSFARIRGKTGVPSIKADRPGHRWRLDHDALGFHFKHFEGKTLCEVDEQEKRVTFNLQRDAFTPVAVLKAFIRIGLSLLPSEELSNFTHALSWVRDPDHTKPFVAQFPFFYTFQPGPLSAEHLSIILMRRKSSITNIPYAFMVLQVANFMYQVFLPTPTYDQPLQDRTLKITPFPMISASDQEKYGTPICRNIDLCGKEKVRGEVVPITMGFEHIQISG